MANQAYVRYRFKTRSAEDYRPLVTNTAMPWWCTGQDDESAVIVAYLPELEALATYWDDAFDVEIEYYQSGPVFSGRFPRPNWYDPNGKRAVLN